jgi:hypothetical protein
MTCRAKSSSSAVPETVICTTAFGLRSTTIFVGKIISYSPWTSGPTAHFHVPGLADSNGMSSTPVMRTPAMRCFKAFRVPE